MSRRGCPRPSRRRRRRRRSVALAAAARRAGRALLRHGDRARARASWTGRSERLRAAMTAPSRTATAVVGAGARRASSRGMVGLAFAAVPLYRLFCQVTGYGGTTQRADGRRRPHARPRDRRALRRQRRRACPGRSGPEMPQVRVKLGETALVNFIAENTGTAADRRHGDLQRPAGHRRASTSTRSSASASPSRRCSRASGSRCRCSSSSRRTWRTTASSTATRTITLSYTFFPVAGARQPVAQAAGDEDGEKHVETTPAGAAGRGARTGRDGHG